MQNMGQGAAADDGNWDGLALEWVRGGPRGARGVCEFARKILAVLGEQTAWCGSAPRLVSISDCNHDGIGIRSRRYIL